MAFIAGNSRCAIEINGDTVRKTSPTSEYSPRLERQVRKQREFKQLNRLWFCRVPSVLREAWDGDIYQVEMQYSNGFDFVEFIKHASRDALDLAAEHLDRIIEQSIAASKVERVPLDVLKAKVAAVGTRVDFPVMDMFLRLPQDDLEIPVGHCHGDLTLSNMLFREGSITVIDFLDNFVETPLQDMCKVRQDTCFKWSIQLYKQPFDRVRTTLALDYLDGRVEELFGKREFYSRHYPIFQFVNLARILPYCETLQLSDHVKECLKRVVSSYV